MEDLSEHSVINVHISNKKMCHVTLLQYNICTSGEVISRKLYLKLPTATTDISSYKVVWHVEVIARKIAVFQDEQ